MDFMNAQGKSDGFLVLWLVSLLREKYIVSKGKLCAYQTSV